MKNNDPRSIYYVRNNVRPKIDFWEIVIYILPLPVSIILCQKVLSIFFEKTIVNTTLIFFILIYIICISKYIMLLLIKLYQKLAPEHIRNKCRFEPSCSNYMIMAIEKFGIIKGLKKGFLRLKKCSSGDGGYDNLV